MINRVSIVLPLHRISTDIRSIMSWLNELPADYQLIIVHDVQVRKFTRDEVINFEKLHSNLKISEGYFGGPGTARNEGLSLVQSKQVAFWDSDDLPNIKNFNQVLDTFIESSFEIAACGYTKIDVKHQSIKTSIPSVSNNLFHIAKEVALWRFMFKTSVLKDIRFPNILLGEDQVFISRVLKDFNKFTTYKKIVYNYRHNSNNQLTSTSSKSKLIKPIIDELFIGIDSENRNQQILNKLLVIRLCLTLLQIESVTQFRTLVTAVFHLILGDLVSLKFNLLIYFRFVLYILSTRLCN